MKKAILIAIVIILSCGAIAKAEPLPLVPGETTAEVTATTAQKPVEKTEETKETGNTETTGERIIEDKEEQAAMAAQENLSLADRMEKGHKDWFALDARDYGELESLGGYLGSAPDHRSKVHLAERIRRGLTQPGDNAKATTEDIKAAAEAMLGFGYSHDGI